jgi:hypothetical protein
VLHPDRPAADHAVDLLLRLAVGRRVLDELAEGEAQQARRGLVAGDEEGDEVVDDGRVAQLLARLGVDAFEHGGQQVAAAGGVLAARVEHALGCAAQHLDVVPVLAVCLAEEDRHQAGPQRAGTRLGQEAGHGVDERVQVIVVVRVEAEVHGAQGERVERQAREVVCHHDVGVGAVACPLERQLRRDLVHLVEHALDRCRAERRHQDAVCDAPAGLVLPRREEAVMHGVADLLERAPDGFVKPLLVAELVHQPLRALKGVGQRVR